MDFMFPKRTITLFAAFIMGLPVIAQIPEHLNGILEAEYVGASDIEGLPQAGEIEIGRAVVFGQEELVGDDIFSDEWGLAVGLRASFWRFESDLGGIADLDVFGFEVPISLISEQLNSFDFDFGVTPGLFSDMDDIDGDHVTVHGRAAISYIFRPEVRLMLGAKYDQAFGEEEVYPYAGFKFSSKNKGVEFDLVFPEPRLAFNPSDTAQIFFYGKAIGGFWHETDVPGGVDADAEVEYSALQGGGGIALEIAYDMWIYLSGGMEFEREFSVNDNSLPHAVTVDLEDSWFARIGVVLK